MTGEEVDHFLKVLGNITERWTFECIRSSSSCGAVLRSHSGKGQISLHICSSHSAAIAESRGKSVAT